MTATIIHDLFAHQIDRRIEEVIKVDQTDERLLPIGVLDILDVICSI